MVFSIFTMLFCVLLILLNSYILYMSLKEIEIIEKNLKDLELRFDDVEDEIKKEQ